MVIIGTETLIQSTTTYSTLKILKNSKYLEEALTLTATLCIMTYSTLKIQKATIFKEKPSTTTFLA